MNRRQFKIPSIREIREKDNTRTRERLEELESQTRLSRQHTPSKSTESENEFDAIDLDTRRMTQSSSGPLSDRLLSHGHYEYVPQKPVTEIKASLFHLDGSEFAALSCDKNAGIIVLGRSKTVTIHVVDPYVHRVHSHIRWDDEARIHVIAHAGGENGTYVNKRRINEPVRLYSGAHIRVGKTELIYRLH
jgi:hypothetical protein